MGLGQWAPGRIPDLRIRSGCSFRSHLQFNIAQNIIRIRLRIRNCMRIITEHDQDQNIKFCPALICRRCAPSNSNKKPQHKAVLCTEKTQNHLVRVNLVWVDGASSLPHHREGREQQLSSVGSNKRCLELFVKCRLACETEIFF
jgi:hypothetical protein